MSIVSRKIDSQMPLPMRNVVKAVGFDKGEPVYPQFAQPPQKPNFNVSRWIRKPFEPTPDYLHGEMGKVPQKCNQFGTQAGSMLFYAPMLQDIEVMRVPVYRATDMRQDESVEMDYDVGRPFMLDYAKGTRPGERKLNIKQVAEPTGPMFRQPKPATMYAKMRPAPTRLQFEDEIVRQVRAL